MALAVWHQSAFAAVERSLWPQGLWLLAGLRAHRLAPNVVSRTAGVRAWGVAGRWRCCQLLLQGVEVDVILCTALASAYGARWRRAAWWLDQQGDRLLRNAVLSACARAKRWHGALQLAEKELVACSVPRRPCVSLRGAEACIASETGGRWPVGIGLVRYKWSS